MEMFAGKRQLWKHKSRILIEVPDRWWIGNGQPLLVERYPNLVGNFTYPDVITSPPALQEKQHFWKKRDRQNARYKLTLAYLAHPEPRIRAAMIQRLSTFGFVDTTSILLDMLVDPSRIVRVAAARAIWEKASGSSPKENSLLCALFRLRDVIQGKGHLFSVNLETALLALDLLRHTRPDRRDDFDRLLVYVWCYGDERLADYGNRLVTIYSQDGTFDGSAAATCRQVGTEIRERDGSIAMQIVAEAIGTALGVFASRELAAVWRGNNPQGALNPLGGNGLPAC